MRAAQVGDARAYGRLLIEVQPSLHRYFARRLPRALIEDAVQETLIALHDRRHSFDLSRPFTPWLFGIARYKWMDQLRTLKKLPPGMPDIEASVGDHEFAVTSAYALAGLLGELKPAQAEVIRQVKLSGRSIDEASRSTGQSNSLVKVNIHRGLRQLSHTMRQVEDRDRRTPAAV